uniref:Uncharacterized protein n=1 Tax=Aegilops tauschii TaxID=37682 RepID=M8BDE8_AEGTA
MEKSIRGFAGSPSAIWPAGIPCAWTNSPEIGFGCMLKLPVIQQLNLKFSAWTISKVSIRRRAIILTEWYILKFWAEDVHKIFGIPFGHRNVRGRDTFIKREAIHFIKSTLGMDKIGVHSLRAAEKFLLQDISETSSKLEKDCFQIAFVIFVMGHVLAPTTKHDYATIDYWGALASIETSHNSIGVIMYLSVSSSQFDGLRRT